MKNKYHTTYEVGDYLTASHKEMARKWAEIIYVEERHRNESDGVDFFTDLDLNKVASTDNVIITLWGKQFESSFHCISGYGLFEVFPFWKNMNDFFINEVGLTPWLPYPCVLLSKAKLRRHIDYGRPCAFNLPLFGLESTQTCLWESVDDPDEDFCEIYSYTDHEAILLNTTMPHGGLPLVEETNLRGIMNMGFAESYAECKERIANFTDEDGSIPVLREILTK